MIIELVSVQQYSWNCYRRQFVWYKL